MPNYQNSMIYKIVNDEMPNMVYYGSTCNTLRQRFSEHKTNYNRCSSKKLFEFGKAQIILVEKFPCNDRIELNQRERFYIENNECVNKNIPIRTPKEYKEKKKEWYEANKEKITDQKKEWYEANKERFNEKKKEKTDCECGGKYIHAHRARHFKTEKHKNYIKNI